MTTYTSGTWGWQAKARSKRRLQYFREYRKKHPVKPQLGFRILGKFDLEGLLQRSHGNCEACGSNKKLLVHHINKDTADNRLENLQLLCRGYHNKVHLRPKVRLWSEEQKAKLSKMFQGAGNPRYSKRWTLEERRKISEAVREALKLKKMEVRNQIAN